MSKRLSSEMKAAIPRVLQDKRQRRMVEKVLLSKKSVVLNQDQAIFLDPISVLSLVQNIPNIADLSSDDLTKYLLRLCVNKDKNLMRISHKRGKSNQRQVWILALGTFDFIIDQNGRDGRAKTKLSVFRPGRIFVWEWAGSLFFSVTGMIDNQPCFWVLCEAPNLNDQIRSKVFKNRMQAIRFTLDLWRATFSDVDVKNDPQANEVFLDNFESLFDLELDIHPHPQQTAQRLLAQLEMADHDEEDRLEIIECFASKLNLDVAEFLTLMQPQKEKENNDEQPPCHEAGASEAGAMQQDTIQEVESNVDDYSDLCFLDSFPVPESIIESVESFMPASLMADSENSLNTETDIDLLDLNEINIDGYDAATDRAEMILRNPWTFEPFNLDELLANDAESTL